MRSSNNSRKRTKRKNRIKKQNCTLSISVLCLHTTFFQRRESLNHRREKKCQVSFYSFKDRANKTRGSVGFDQLGKLIGECWRRISSQGIQKYHNLVRKQENNRRMQRESRCSLNKDANPKNARKRLKMMKTRLNGKNEKK